MVAVSFRLPLEPEIFNSRNCEIVPFLSDLCLLLVYKYYCQGKPTWIRMGLLTFPSSAPCGNVSRGVKMYAQPNEM